VGLGNGANGFVSVLGVNDGNSKTFGYVEDDGRDENPVVSQASARAIPSSGSMDGCVV